MRDLGPRLRRAAVATRSAGASARSHGAYAATPDEPPPPDDPPAEAAPASAVGRGVSCGAGCATCRLARVDARVVAFAYTWMSVPRATTATSLTDDWVAIETVRIRVTRWLELPVCMAPEETDPSVIGATGSVTGGPTSTGVGGVGATSVGGVGGVGGVGSTTVGGVGGVGGVGATEIGAVVCT